MAVYVPVAPIPHVPSGAGDVSGSEAVIIGALIITALICVGIPIYGLYRDYRDLCRWDREAKKKEKRKR